MDGRNVHELTPLFRAAFGGDLEVVQSLLTREADGRTKTSAGHTPVRADDGAGHAAIVERLLGCGADVNASTSDGQTGLFLAVCHGHMGAAQSLLRRGADVNAREVSF